MEPLMVMVPTVSPWPLNTFPLVLQLVPDISDGLLCRPVLIMGLTLLAGHITGQGWSNESVCCMQASVTPCLGLLLNKRMAGLLPNLAVDAVQCA